MNRARSGGDGTATTPRARRPNKVRSSTKGSATKRKRGGGFSDDDDDDVGMLCTPVKKEEKTAGGAFKVYDSDDSGIFVGQSTAEGKGSFGFPGKIGDDDVKEEPFTPTKRGKSVKKEELDVDDERDLA